MGRLILGLIMTIIFQRGSLCAQVKNGSAPTERGKNSKATDKGEPKEEDGQLVFKRRLAEERLGVIGRRAQTLENSILKVRILAKAGDGLWKHDETQARQLFLLAFQTIDSIKLDPKEDQRAAMAEKRGGTIGALFNLRSFVLQLISRHDFKLAEKLRKSLEKDPSNIEKKTETLNPEEARRLRLNMALALAATQPERSASIIRQVLREGLDDSLVFSLMGMRSANQKLADQLFTEAMQTSAEHGMVPNDFLNLSFYVLPTEDDLFFGNDPLADPARASITRAFLSYVYEGSKQAFAADNFVASGNEIDRGMAARSYYALQKLIPIFERLQPQRVPFIRERSRSLLGLMNPSETVNAESAREDSADELLHQAESTIGETRRTLRFIRASSAALTEGDIDKAVAIAERIDDLRERKIQTSLILYQAASRQLQEANVEQAYQYAKRIEFLPQRVAVMRRIAQKLWALKQPERALTILDDLREWLSKADDSGSKANAMLSLTETVVEYDRERGFVFLEATVTALNKTDFSFKPPPPGQLSVELQVAPDMLDLESTFPVLARENFDRAYALAALLAKPELSLLAQTLVCTDVLTPR
jgi:hypothetical protein